MKRTIPRIIATLFVAALAWGASPARADEPLTLVYAVYDNESAAMNSFKSLQEAQREQIVRLQSFAVISKDANGKVHVQRSNQKRGTIAGAVVGGLLGAIGGPAGVAVGATAGGAMGHATGEAFGIPREDINSIKQSLPPGSSALIAVIDERWAGDLSRSLQQTDARRVLNTKIEQGAAPSSGTQQQQPSTPETQPGTQPQP